MSKAFKCDRCGVYYDSKSVPNYRGGELIIKQSGYSDSGILDLCLVCRGDLESFVKNVTVYHRENDK